MKTDTPTVTAKAMALDRDQSASDRHRYEEMMMLAARFERETIPRLLGRINHGS